jgi:hypothetical protein
MKILSIIVGLAGTLCLGIAGAIIFNSAAFTAYNIYNHMHFSDLIVESGFFGFLFLGIGIWLILVSIKHKETK